MGRTIRRRRRGGDVDARMSPMKVSDRVAMYNMMPKMAAKASMRPTVSQKQRVLERVAGVSPSTGMSVKERMATLNKSSSSPVSKSYSAPAMGNVHALVAHNATLGGRRRKSRKHRKGTKKDMRRKTARKAYMKRRKSRKGGGFFSRMFGAKDKTKSAAVATESGQSRGVSAVDHGARNMDQWVGGGLVDEFKKWKDKGCPEGKTRMFGAHCGFFRGPFGCCRKQLQFSDLKFGGKKTKKIS